MIPLARCIIRSILLAGLALLLAAMASVQARAEEPIRVQLTWFHQAQFAGFYVAAAKGYYEEEGLEVELVEGGSGINPLQQLAIDRADVAVAWLPSAINARRNGLDAVNIGQILARAGTTVVCRRSPELRSTDDIAGKRIGVWNMGDEINVEHWLHTLGLSTSDVTIVEQRPNGQDILSGRVDCATAMTYNEYWSLLGSDIPPEDLLVTRLSDQDQGFLEDGLYVREQALADPARRGELARFLRATVRGWEYAAAHHDEAYAITMARQPDDSPEHQRHMLDEILKLVGPAGRIGHLDIAAFDRSVRVIASSAAVPERIHEAAAGAWTHRLWYEAALGSDTTLTLTSSTRHYLDEMISWPGFNALVLISGVVFGLAGFMRAQQQRYDLWGAFIFTLLPAAGGGTIRDLLIGGERSPPFIVQDPVYIYVVLGTVGLGLVISTLLTPRIIASRAYDKIMKFLDTLGFAAFAVIGAQVAIMADLSWIWVPICAALTCSGGGMLLDIFAGREPATFQGEPYEELAIMGGIFMLLGLQIADAFEHSQWIVTAVVVASLAFMFVARGLVIIYGVRSHRLGTGWGEDRPAPSPSGAGRGRHALPGMKKSPPAKPARQRR